MSPLPPDYPWYVTVIFLTLLLGCFLPTLYAFYSGEWRWLFITAASLFAIFKT